MASLINLDIKCSRCRQRTATVELVDWNDEKRGRFCNPCGNAELQQRQEYEDTHHPDGTPNTTEGL